VQLFFVLGRDSTAPVYHPAHPGRPTCGGLRKRVPTERPDLTAPDLKK